MEREDIIRLAEKCGIPEFENNESQADCILNFAALVASYEREACAKVCEAYDHADPLGVSIECAAAIRSRT